MAGRPLLRELRSSNETICRSCRLAIRQRPTQRIAATYSTKSTAHQAIDDAVTRKPTKFELKQYLDRIKSLRNPSQDNESFSVRFFEQNDNKRTELSGEEAFGDSLNELDTSGLKDA